MSPYVWVVIGLLIAGAIVRIALVVRSHHQTSPHHQYTPRHGGGNGE